MLKRHYDFCCFFLSNRFFSRLLLPLEVSPPAEGSWERLTESLSSSFKGCNGILSCSSMELGLRLLKTTFGNAAAVAAAE